MYNAYSLNTSYGNLGFSSNLSPTWEKVLNHGSLPFLFQNMGSVFPHLEGGLYNSLIKKT
jgi:hypothetical protein